MNRSLAIAAKAFRIGAYLSCYVAAFFAWLAFQVATEAADDARTASSNARLAQAYSEDLGGQVKAIQDDTAHIRMWCK